MGSNNPIYVRGTVRGGEIRGRKIIGEDNIGGRIRGCVIIIIGEDDIGGRIRGCVTIIIGGGISCIYDIK